MDEIDQGISFLWQLLKIIISAIIQSVKIGLQAITQTLPIMFNSYKKK